MTASLANGGQSFVRRSHNRRGRGRGRGGNSGSGSSDSGNNFSSRGRSRGTPDSRAQNRASASLSSSPRPTSTAQAKDFEAKTPDSQSSDYCKKVPFTVLRNDGNNGKHKASCFWISLADAIRIMNNKHRREFPTALELRALCGYPDRSQSFDTDRDRKYAEIAINHYKLDVVIYGVNIIPIEGSGWIPNKHDLCVRYQSSNAKPWGRLSFAYFGNGVNGHYELITTKTSHSADLFRIANTIPELKGRAFSFRYIPLPLGLKPASEPSSKPASEPTSPAAETTGENDGIEPGTSQPPRWQSRWSPGLTPGMGELDVEELEVEEVKDDVANRGEQGTDAVLLFGKLDLLNHQVEKITRFQENCSEMRAKIRENIRLLRQALETDPTVDPETHDYMIVMQTSHLEIIQSTYGQLGQRREALMAEQKKLQDTIGNLFGR